MKAFRSVCGTCGFAGAPLERVPGSALFEIVLWLCFLVPGLLYSLWRVTSAKPACAMCQATTMIPAGSPRGQELIAKTGWTPQAEEHYRAAVRAEAKSGYFLPVIVVVFGLLTMGIDAKIGGVMLGVGALLVGRKIVVGRVMIARIQEEGAVQS